MMNDSQQLISLHLLVNSLKINREIDLLST